MSQFLFQEHEKTCQEDDDVIFCGEEFSTNIDKQLQEQSSFLHNFSLVNPNFPMPNQSKTPIKKNNEQSSSSGKYGRQPRRSQIVLSSNIPFSSPAGQQLMKLSKSSLAHNYIQDKLERSERYCDTSTNWLKPIKYNRIPVTFRRPQDQTYRWYRFPRRQNYRSWYRQAFLNLNINELKLCRPVTVKLKKLTNNDIEAFHLENSYKNRSTLNHLNIVDVIDLCSDDDDNDNDFSNNGAATHHDIENVSQTATTPASRKSPAFTDPLQTTFEMDNENSSQATMPMFNTDENYQYQNHENHQSFLNGAQGSIVAQIDKLTELKDISMQANQAHISIDLTL